MMLVGERVRLRAVEPEDLDLMHRVENDTRLWVYGSTSVPYSKYALRRYIEASTCDIYADKSLRLVATTPEGEPLGFMDLQNFDPQHRRAEVGVLILPEYQGRGLGSEALQLLLDYASAHLHLHQVYAFVATENKAAMQLFAKAKFKPSGTLSEWLYKGASDYADACLFTCILD